MKVAIVGGGVTGLSCAFYLEREGITDIVLFEAADRLGGKIRTIEENCFTVELGADAIFTRKPAVLDLIKALGLESEVIQPAASQFSILLNGKLQPVPHGLLRFGATDEEALAQASFLSEEAKSQVREEQTAPPGSGGDESIASFFRRRYGVEYSQKIAEPLLAGTHGGAPEQLSMQALYPAYLRMEREHGSLTAAARKAKAQPSELSTFISFRRGSQTLTDKLATRLKHTRIVHENLTQIPTADHVVLAVPPSSASCLLPLAAAGQLNAIPTASSAIVTLGYSSNLDLHGSGFLVPYIEPSKITGATWTSNKWSGRAPNGSSLLRVFLGREGSVDTKQESDDSLISMAQETIAGLVELPQKPEYVRLQRWTDALPLYEIGHEQRIEAAEACLRNIYLAGQAYRGAGIPDCVRQGRDVAAKIAQAHD